MTKEKVAELLRRAFMEGFAISREGFNGECAFDHIAPDGLRLEQLRDITVDAIIQDEWQQD